MFSKLSRYHKVPDVVTLDSQGRLLAAKALRLLPTVTGVFRHTVTGGDRLDQLAYQYYQQPRKWWLICDANPHFLAPAALLGQEAVVTARFPVTVTDDNEPPWAALFAALGAVNGVEAIHVEETVEQAPQPRTGNGKPVTVWLDRYQRAVLVTYNQLLVDSARLADAILASGFTPRQPTIADQLGQSIVIPPNKSG